MKEDRSFRAEAILKMKSVHQTMSAETEIYD